LGFVIFISIEKNEMGGACSAYGGEERRIKGFGGETRHHLGHPGVDGRIILRWIFFSRTKKCRNSTAQTRKWRHSRPQK
jgi:hypothetical protein